MKNEIIIMYFNIEKVVVDYRHENNSKYGESVIKVLVKELHFKYGVVFNKSNVYYAIKFYEIFSKFLMSRKSMNQNLTWSHIREILNLNNVDEINYYIKEINNKKMTIKEIRNTII